MSRPRPAERWWPASRACGDSGAIGLWLRARRPLPERRVSRPRPAERWWSASRACGDSGAIGLWLLGLCLLLLALGGVSLDLWRAFSERRALAGAVDAAAIAGAGGIDLAALHGEGTLRLDPARARALATTTLAADPGAPTLASAEITSSAEAVTVRASAPVELTLLRVLAADKPLEIGVTATSGPRLAAP